ncbi:hypothetical protein ACQYWY_20365 [Comamonas sediminis]|uniref:hypothetical protein n=1 Tax=Comamonas sediminis TaxID=1783360 RepID=UPI003D2C9AB8
MAFALAQTETFKSTVKVNVKTKNGAWREETFTAIFKRTDEDGRERLLGLKNIELLREVMTGWEGMTVSEDDKTAVPFSPENFEAFLKLTGAVREAALQYINDNFNVKESRAKN